MLFLGMGLSGCLELKSVLARLVDIFVKKVSNKELAQINHLKTYFKSDAEIQNMNIPTDSLINV